MNYYKNVNLRNFIRSLVVTLFAITIISFANKLFKQDDKVAEQRFEVVSVSNNTGITGGGSSLYCWIDTEEFINFWVLEGDSCVRKKYSIEMTKVYEDATEGKAYAYIKTQFNTPIEIKLHVPPNTIQRNIKLE